jgi:hypothetical protein
MAVVRRSISSSGLFLTKTVVDMAESLGKRNGPALSSKKVMSGYILIAKKNQTQPDVPGLPPHMQSPLVRNSVHLNAIILDCPGYLCLPGRYIIGSNVYLEFAYVQPLPLGRDTYMPGAIDDVLESQDDPPALAGPYTFIKLGSEGAGNKVATRVWGVGTSFNGAGCAYGFAAVYLSLNQLSWALSYAREGDPFVYVIHVLSPSNVLWTPTDTPGQFSGQGNVNSPMIHWSLEIGESVLAAVGAKAFVRRMGVPSPNYEATWDLENYPWMTFSAPQPYVDDDGQQSYRMIVAGQVVYDLGGPYYTDDTPNEYGWGSGNFKRAAGSKGLWACLVDVNGLTGKITAQYKIDGADDPDEDRHPWKVSEKEDDPQPAGTWYQPNHHFKSSPVMLDTGEGVMIDISYVQRTKEDEDSPTPSTKGANLFVDVCWFIGGGSRSQAIKKTRLRADIYDKDGEQIMSQYGHDVKFDAGDDEMRFFCGSATDGEVMVSVLFSTFIPDSSPLLSIVVANRSGASVAYSGKPGFAQNVSSALDEAVTAQYTDHPILDPDAEDPNDRDTSRYWTMPTGDGQVSYIGNGRFMFYVSSEWTTPEEDDVFFTPKGNLAVAIFDLEGGVELAGVIDSTLSDSGVVGGGVTGGATLTQVYWGPRVGRIEVVRPESDNYNASTGKGHPATLIATRGWGAPSISVPEQNGQDIRNGTTWISYDSGASWTVMLNYGSPAGAFHCGNAAQARDEPIVRV